MNEQEQAKAELIKNIDSFFGFKVEESIVLLFVGEDYSVNYHVRVDLSEEGVASVPEILTKVPQKEQDQGVICLVLSENMELAQAALLNTMRLVILTGGKPLDAIVCNGIIWESLTGDNGIIDGTPSELEYKLAERGIFNFPSRQDAIAQFHKQEPSDGVMDEIRNIMDRHTENRQDISQWRQKVVDFLRSYDREELTDAQVAFLAFAAADQITSKILITEVTLSENPEEMLHLWRNAFPRTPEDYRWAVGEILAWSLAIEGSRSFMSEVIPYCNPYSATFQALMIAMDMNMTAHTMAYAIKKSELVKQASLDAMLLPMVSSAVEYMVNKHETPDNPEPDRE
jgi:hypothetical protein